MNRRRDDDLDREISERQRTRSKAFEQASYRPEYTQLGMQCSMSRTSFEQCARLLGPSFIYRLYVHPVKLLEARNRARECVALALNNPFAPYISIIETPEFEEGEWCLEANDKAYGTSFQW